MKLVHLPDRAVLEISGAQRVTFLQGLVSNDVAAARPGQAVWAALLTPQGKYVADFFILAAGERLLLDCVASQRELVASRILRYRIREQVSIAPVDLLVYAAWDGVADFPGSIAAPDPRLEAAGWRVLSPTTLAETASLEEWQRHRLLLGLPDGPPDLEADKTILLEAGFDELHGVSWTKGCYLGQELTARTRYRGLVKRRLVPVRVTGMLPPPGTPVMMGGADAGTLRSGSGDLALATLRLEAITGSALTAGDAGLTPIVPDWLRLNLMPG